MSKIMLVEDDSNLREIYGERLIAEGYDIVAASDGEEALALAIKEKPDLIISDVMMPKISGFDMLDILRQTPETKDIKVIMMTALSQVEDKNRASKLGADKYLVKSQVTLEDVTRVVNDLLAEMEKSPIAENDAKNLFSPENNTSQPTESVVSTPADQPVNEPSSVNPISDQAVEQEITDTNATKSANAQSTENEASTINKQMEDFANSKVVEPSSTEAPYVEPSAQDIVHAQSVVAEEPTILRPSSDSDDSNKMVPSRDNLENNIPPVVDNTSTLEPASVRKLVIQPPERSEEEDIHKLYADEMALEAANVSLPPEGESDSSAETANPISTDASENTDIDESAPLETVDTSQINGISFNSDTPETNIEEPLVVAEPDQTPLTVEPEQANVDTTSNPQSDNKTDPNQIAL